jgi:hypothetical protein
MEQWQDSTVVVLESCAHYFVKLDQKCNAKILAWLADSSNNACSFLKCKKLACFKCYEYQEDGELEKQVGLALGSLASGKHKIKEQM